MKTAKWSGMVLVLLVLALARGLAVGTVSQAAASEAIAVIRQTCSGYSGPYPCYTSLAAWEAAYGGLPNGNLVAQDKIAVARIEGTWTQADTTRVEIGGWTTDADHYIRIYTAPEARHNGTAGSGYRLVSTDSSALFYVMAAYVRVEGLEFNAASTGAVIYLRPNTAAGVGEIHLSHNLIHGDRSSIGYGVLNYDCRGVIKVWNNIIYDVGAATSTAGIGSSVGTVYAYNNTIVDIVNGFALRSDNGSILARNNLTDAPSADDFRGGFAAGCDFNASTDATALGLYSRRNQTFTFVNRAGKNFHLAESDTGARNHGLDLSGDPYLALTNDIDGQTRSGAWDIGADETGGTDAVVPVRFAGAPSGTLPRGTTQTTLSLSTNEAATCRYATTAGVAYESMPFTFATTGGLTHAQLVTGLVGGQTYTYYVRCRDGAGNTNNDDYAITFDVFSSDTIPPVISNVRAINVTPYSAEIAWDTNEPCTSQVEYGLGPEYGTLTVLSTTRVLSHSMLLLGLDPETTYHFRVRSKDVAYNETVSGNYTFTTAALGNFRYVNKNHPQASDSNPGTIDLPWKTIQHAADVAQPGDTIIVYPGDYNERVQIWTEGGTPGNYITFKGLNVPDRSRVDPNARYDPAHPVLTPGNPAVNAVVAGFVFRRPPGTTYTIDYVRIENFEITRIWRPDAGIDGRGGIFLENTAHVQIVRNFLHDLNPNDNNFGGIRADNPHVNDWVVVKENTLYRVQGTGINIAGRNWLVEGNTISHGLDTNTDTGKYVGGDSDAMRFFGSGHIIRNNYSHDHLDEEQYGDPHMDCFQTFAVYPSSQFAYDILVEGNTCDNFDQLLMISDNQSGNYVHHITFRNNILLRSRAFAINGSCDHFTLINNVVAESGYGAVNLNNSPYLTVLNNIFYNNGSGSQVSDEASRVGTVWDYNIHYPDFSWPPKKLDFDQHSLFGVDPGFVNPAAGNYRLRTDSPAIDRGLVRYDFNYDFARTLRPQLAGWDIGAYEAVPELELQARGGDRTIHLTWQVNATLPPTGTWRVEYYTRTATIYTATNPYSTTRSLVLTQNVHNYQWYTVTLHAMLGSTSFLSDTVRVMPTDRFVYLPLVMKGK
ncbi:MAG: right-handed parallel beta-helix repeat-containing protein [Anaerolineae bacterium]